MSKTMVYKCDSCGVKVFDREPEWLEIGSNSDKELYINNSLNDTCGLTMINYHSPIHLCSKKCLIRYFFGPEDAEMFSNAKIIRLPGL